jgi:hypothetical protein
MNGPYGAANKASIEKIISASASSLSTASNNFQPKLELRVFYNTNSAYKYGSASAYATGLANALKSHLTSASASTGATSPSLNTSTNTTALSAFTSQIAVMQVDSNDGAKKKQHTSKPQILIDNALYNYVVDCWIVFDNTDVTAPGEFRSPSTQAYSYARQIAQQTQTI